MSPSSSSFCCCHLLLLLPSQSSLPAASRLCIFIYIYTFIAHVFLYAMLCYTMSIWNAHRFYKYAHTPISCIYIHKHTERDMYMLWLFTPYMPHTIQLKLAMVLCVASSFVSFVAAAAVSCYHWFCLLLLMLHTSNVHTKMHTHTHIPLLLWSAAHLKSNKSVSFQHVHSISFIYVK